MIQHHTAAIDNNIKLGTQLGVSGTPAFFINGRKSSGALPYESLKPRIDWFLNPKGPIPAVLPPPPASSGKGAVAMPCPLPKSAK